MDGFSRLVPSARGLLIFEAAARRGSFTAAAAEFNISQPSVSRNIAQLEAALGVTLFERRASGLTLTGDGRDLHGAVHDGLERIGEALLRIRARTRPSRQVVTLSLSGSFVAHWLLPRLGRFNATFPEVDLRFDLIPGILRAIPDTVDLATRILPDDGQYHRWDLAPEIILPVCSPAYHRTRGPWVEGAREGHAFLHLSEHSPKLWGAGSGKGGPGKGAPGKGAPGIWHEFSDYAIILQAALNGEGIALGWVSVVASALIAGTLVPASDWRLGTGRFHTLLAPKARPLDTVVAAIAEWLAAESAEDVERLSESAAWRSLTPREAATA
ncbi:LysR family transcriptional regulator [Methylobacterium terricola]|uniref:LysR family transcriptional regulator n=1 Tax=Methylobacterium terricola TaxID=2583531 RepID=A0A5C4LEF0_9HYPH|nr:LysR family transcriptional regulator [Methylobacterium terricola]TNC09986.1 LysR family transcriptional regulator [Methylobacterium terricola]